MKILSRKWWEALYDDFPLRSYQEWIIEEKTNKREGKEKKTKRQVPKPYQKKHNFLAKKKKDKVKRKKKMTIIKEKIENTAKGKCRFRREEKLGPQASSRVTPCPPAPNHTRGEVIRPPSQIKNNSYSVIWTRDLDDLSCTRARLPLPLDHLETSYLISINCRCKEFWNTLISYHSLNI